MPIVIIPNDRDTPAGKLADAELHFTTGPLAGLRLVGFAIWESQWPGKNRNHQFLRVTVPSRTYVKDGQEKRYDLLRAAGEAEDPASADSLRDAILDAYAETAGGPIAQAQETARQVAQAARAPRQAPAVARPLARQAPPRPAPAPSRTPSRSAGRNGSYPLRHDAGRNSTPFDDAPPHGDHDMPF